MASNVLQFPRLPANDADDDNPPPAPVMLSMRLRGQIEMTIEYLVSLLDTIDGDCDLEAEEDHCEAGDDGCGYYHLWSGSGAWGSSWDDEGVFGGYGVDQSLGPVNDNSADERIAA